MSKFIATAALSAVFAGAITFSGTALAQTQERPLTRAEVIADLQQARASGELARQHSESGGYARLELRDNSSAVSRAAVVAELKRAQAAGELDNAFRESASHQFGQSPVKAQASGLTRAEVKAELDRARRSGELVRLNRNDSHDYTL